MSTLSLNPPVSGAAAARRPWYGRIPFVSRIGRELASGEPETLIAFLVILVTVLVLAVRTWGLVALGLTALAMVPVVFVLLITISLGK